MNVNLLSKTNEVTLVPYMELDEQWSFVQNKGQQRWLWLAICHTTSKVLAYCFGKRTLKSFEELLSLMKPFKVKLCFSDNWQAYSAYIPEEHHQIGKRNTQKIERKFLTFRTRVKRLCRRTICFSKDIGMHDTVIGLFINRHEFGLKC